MARIFEVVSITLAVFTVILVITRYKNQRDYWYAVIGLGLCFPFEWWADWSYWHLLYSKDFIMFPAVIPFFDRLPLIMPFAFIFFYSLPLIITLRFQDKLDPLPVWRQFLTLFVIYLAWDVVVEYTSTFGHVYNYHVPEKWLIGGVLPVYLSACVSFTSVMTYFTHKLALKYSAGKSWGVGLLIHIGAYYVMFLVFEQLLLWTLVAKILGVPAAPSYFTS